MKILAVVVLIAASALADLDLESGYSQFSAEVVKEIASRSPSNLIVCPLSAYTVLGLTELGAGGATAEELRTRIHLPSDLSKFKALLPKKSPQFVVNAANAIYARQGFQLKDSFTKQSLEIFQADVQSLDFNNRVATAKSIDDWVANVTQNNIQDLVTPDDITEATQLLLVNALYFEANFTNQFRLNKTKRTKFLTSGRSAVDVETLHSEEGYRYNFLDSRKLQAKFLELPLGGHDASIIFALPDAVSPTSALDLLVNALGTRDITLAQHPVSIRLPKFRIENQIDFGTVLKNLGVKRAFDSSQADFSGIAGQPGDLYIEKILQKAVINLNENGIRAAAATDAVFNIKSLPNSDPNTLQEFHVDRPFAFLIRVGSIPLFEGYVVNPTD